MACSALTLTAEDICTPLNGWKPCATRRENTVLSVTPSKLKFPFNNTLAHTDPINIWNKTRHTVQFRILPPRTYRFQVNSKHGSVFPNAVTTIYVTCYPENTETCMDCLEIRINCQLCHLCQQCIRVPLEVLPKLDWFYLPKFLALPLAPLDRRVQASIEFPVPPDDYGYKFCIVSPPTQYFDVQPRCGMIGGPDGVTSLQVSFRSHEYITLTYKLQIQFPGTDSEPYEINIFGRCVPNLESEEIRKDVAAVEALTSETCKKKIPKQKSPRFRLGSSVDDKKLLGWFLLPPGKKWDQRNSEKQEQMDLNKQIQDGSVPKTLGKFNGVGATGRKDSTENNATKERNSKDRTSKPFRSTQFGSESKKLGKTNSNDTEGTGRKDSTEDKTATERNSKDRPSLRFMSTQLRNIGNEMRNLPRRLTRSSLDNFYANALKALQEYQKQFNEEINRIKEKMDSISIPFLEDHQHDVNQEIDETLELLKNLRRDSKLDANRKSEIPTDKKQDVINHKINFNDAMDNLLKDIDANPKLEKLKDNIGRIFDYISNKLESLTRSSNEYRRPSEKFRESVLKAEKIINEKILRLFDISPPPSLMWGGADGDLKNRNSLQSRSAKHSVGTLEDYRHKLNELYNKVLDGHPDEDIYKNQTKFNKVMDDLEGKSEFKPMRMSLLNSSRKSSHPINSKEVKDIQRRYNSIMSKIQEGLYNPDLTKVQQEFNDLINKQLKNRNSMESDSGETFSDYRHKLNELYNKVLDGHPDADIYKNQTKFNNVMDDLEGSSRKSEFKPMRLSLFNASRKSSHPLRPEDLKQIQRKYNSIMSKIQEDYHNPELKKVQQEFNDLLNKQITDLKNRNSMESDSGETLSDYRHKLNELYNKVLDGHPDADIYKNQTKFNNVMDDLEGSSRKSEFKPMRLSLFNASRKSSHPLKSEDLKQIQRKYNSIMSKIQEDYHNPELKKVQQEFNDLLNKQITDLKNRNSMQARSGKRSPGTLADYRQKLNELYDKVLDGRPDKRMYKNQMKFNNVMDDLAGISNDPRVRFTAHEVKPMPLLNTSRKSHPLTSKDLKEIQRQYNSIMSELQDGLNNRDLEEVQQEFNDLMNEQIIMEDPELSKIYSDIFNEVKNLKSGGSPHSSSDMISDIEGLTPQELARRREKIRRDLKKIPKHLMTPEMQAYLDDLDTWFDLEIKKQREKILKGVLPEINKEINYLQDQVENQDVADLQKSLNTQLFEMLELPVDKTLMKQITSRPFRPSRTLPGDISRDELKFRKRLIHDAIDRLPSAYKTRGVKDVQKSLDNKIDYLLDQLDLISGLPKVEKYLQEIAVLEEVFPKRDITEAREKLQQEFTRIFKLPPNHWKKNRSDKLAKVLVPLSSAELAEYREEITLSFQKIPPRFRTPRIKILHNDLMNAIKNFEKKMGGGSQSQNDLGDNFNKDIAALKDKIETDIRNARKKMLANVSRLQSKPNRLNEFIVAKAKGKMRSSILAVRDSLTEEIKKLFNKVGSKKNLKNKLNYLQNIKTLQGITENRINSVLNELDQLLHTLRDDKGRLLPQMKNSLSEKLSREPSCLNWKQLLDEKSSTQFAVPPNSSTKSFMNLSEPDSIANLLTRSKKSLCQS